MKFTTSVYSNYQQDQVLELLSEEFLNPYFFLSSKRSSALSGNRTPVSRVAGENSTTEPTMHIDNL